MANLGQFNGTARESKTLAYAAVFTAADTHERTEGQRA
jgi:hypothetical protein